MPDMHDMPDEPELPRRPRRRLLGAGGNPIALALLAVLLIACGFIGGVLVEKGQGSSSSAGGGAGGLGARFAALRAGASATGSRTATAGGGSRFLGGGTGGFAGGGAGGASPGRTAGQVAYLAGKTLYVTNSEGSTVKVTTSAGTTVDRTVSSHVKAIHPGETVTILGAAGAAGAIDAESISVLPSTGSPVTLFGSG